MSSYKNVEKLTLRCPELMKSICKVVENSLDSFCKSDFIEAVPNEELVKFRLVEYLNKIKELRKPLDLDKYSEGRKMRPVQIEWAWGDKDWKFNRGSKPDVIILETEKTHFKPNSDQLGGKTYISNGDCFLFEVKHWHHSKVNKARNNREFKKVLQGRNKKLLKSINECECKKKCNSSGKAIWEVFADIEKVKRLQNWISENYKHQKLPFVPGFFLIYSTVDEAADLWPIIEKRLEIIKAKPGFSEGRSPLKVYLRTPNQRRCWPHGELRKWK